MFSWWTKKVSPHADKVRNTLSLVESSALLFPTLVTLIASITFLCGGCIGVWQWWAGVALIIGWVAWHRCQTLKTRLWAVGLFLLLLAGITVLTCSLNYYGGVDTKVYHFPAIRLLIKGWNPVTAATPELLASTMNIDPWGMRLWHVLSTSKSVWYFSAVANTFTGATFNLLLPLFPLLFIGAAGQVWRLLRGWNVWLKVAALALLYVLSPGVILITDSAVFFGGIGLLAAMTRHLRGDKGTLLPLILLSFWMMTAKMPGLLSCFVFWATFGIWLLVRNKWRTLPYLTGIGATLTLLLAITCAAPYITSAIHYGHPLYPAYTVDEERFPTHDITPDFRLANADAEAMSHLGAFVHAYISPTLATTYYQWRLGQETFAPNRYVWWQAHAEGGYQTTPLNTRDRLTLLFSFLIVAFAGKRFRFIAVAALLGTLCIPTCYLGFTRYISWVAGVILFAKLILLNLACTIIYRYWRSPLVWAVICCGVALWHLRHMPLSLAVTIDTSYTLRSYLKETPPKKLYCFLFSKEWLARTTPDGQYFASPETFGLPSQTPQNDLRLLCETFAPLKNTTVHPLTLDEEADYKHLCDTAMRVAPGTPLPETELSKISSLPNRKERLMRYPFYMLKVYTITLPKLMWGRD